MQPIRFNSEIDGPPHRQTLDCIRKASYYNFPPARGTFDSGLTQFLQDDDVYTFVNATETNTSAIVITNARESEACIYISGLNDRMQIPSLVRAFTSRQPADKICGEPYNRAAEFIRAVVNAQLFPSPHFVTIAGHSFGGATAMCLGALLKRDRQNSLMKIITYGAPRCLYRGYANVWRNYAFIARCWTPLDPVVRTLPSFTDLQRLYQDNNENIDRSHSWAAWSQPVTGYEVASNGTMRPLQDSAAPLLGGFLGLGAWLGSVDAYGSTQHALTSYANYFAATAAVPRPETQPLHETIRQGPIPSLSRAEERRQSEEAVGAQAREVEANPVAFVDQFMSAVPAVPHEIFRKASSRNLRWITYAGNTVTYCTGKRQQKSLCKYFNKRLRGQLN